MPSKSKSQAHLMAAVAHNPAFAKKVGIPVSVGKEFNKADKGRKFREGGEMKESKAMMKREVAFMKKKGAPESMLKHEMAEAKGMKKGGMAGCEAVAKKEVKGHEKRMHGMARGGILAEKIRNEKSELKRVGAKERDAGFEMKRVKSEMAVDKSKMGMCGGGKVKKMARGGGIEIKGKTKGTMIKMKGC